jgi:hypothetical protein
LIICKKNVEFSATKYFRKLAVCGISVEHEKNGGEGCGRGMSIHMEKVS